jgi:hypothetical protein
MLRNKVGQCRHPTFPWAHPSSRQLVAASPTTHPHPSHPSQLQWRNSFLPMLPVQTFPSTSTSKQSAQRDSGPENSYATRSVITDTLLFVHNGSYSSLAKRQEKFELVRAMRMMSRLPHCLDQWFPTCGTRTPGGTWRTGWEYAKIILVLAQNTKKKKRS